MERPIVGFHRDEEAHWVAELSCGHGQHLRHAPPFRERPWVETAEGRADRIGRLLDCPRCDRLELPGGHAPYRRTATFTRETVPRGLTAAHTTKRGVWGVIHVLRGELDYCLDGPYALSRVLDPEHPGIVPPEVEHRVAIRGEVEFYVEFWRG